MANDDLEENTFVSTEEKIHEDLPKCFVVYSDQAHVEYIFNLINPLKQVLEKHRLEPRLLGDGIRSGDGYLEKLSEFIDEAVLGIVILDGLRPNVAFEFGFLKGRNKPTIILQSRNSSINIKTLYQNQIESGLEPRYFPRLNNPKLNAAKQLSDFAGRHIAFIEKHAKDTDEMHITKVLEKELELIKLQELIINNQKNNSSQFLHGDLLSETTPDIVKLSTMNSDIEHSKVHEIDNIVTSIKNTFEKFNSRIPMTLIRLMAETYYSKGHNVKDDKSKALELVKQSIKIYEDSLSNPHEKTKNSEKAFVNKRLGNFYTTVDSVSKTLEHFEQIESYYKKALGLIDEKKQKLFYAFLMKDLSELYKRVGQKGIDPDELNKSIKYAKIAIENFPNSYSHELYYMNFQIASSYYFSSNHKNKLERITNCLDYLDKAFKFIIDNEQKLGIEIARGNAYLKLSEIHEPRVNVKKAIEHYENVINNAVNGINDEMIALSSQGLGNAYYVLLQLEQNEELSTKGIDALNRACTIWTENEFPLKHATAQLSIGNLYGAVARIQKNKEQAIETTKNALLAYENAKRLGIGRTPEELSGFLLNMGNAFGTLGELGVDIIKNCEKSIQYLNDALEIKYGNENDEIHSMCYQNIGATYLELAKVKEPIKSYTNAINAFDNVLRIGKYNKNDVEIAMANFSKGIAYFSMAENNIKDFCDEGIKCIEESLKFYTKETDPFRHDEASELLTDLKKICKS